MNRDKLSDKPQIFVSNHQSFIDSLVLGSLLPAGILYNTIFLAIDWYFKKGILKLLVSHGNVVLIDINKNIKKSVEEIAEKMYLFSLKVQELKTEKLQNLKKYLQ